MTTTADTARFAVLAAQSDRRIVKTKLIEEAREFARYLTDFADELDDDDTFSVIALSLIEQNTIALTAARFRHLNDKTNTVEKLVADLVKPFAVGDTIAFKAGEMIPMREDETFDFDPTYIDEDTSSTVTVTAVHDETVAWECDASGFEGTATFDQIVKA